MSDPCIKKEVISMMQKNINAINNRLDKHSEKMDSMHDDNVALETHTAVLQTLIQEQKIFNQKMFDTLDNNQDKQNTTVEKLFNSIEQNQKEQNSINRNIEHTLVGISDKLEDLTTGQVETSNKISKMSDEYETRFARTEQKIDFIDDKSKVDIMPFLTGKILPVAFGSGAIYGMIELFKYFAK